jgi:hypothetical protein
MAAEENRRRTREPNIVAKPVGSNQGDEPSRFGDWGYQAAMVTSYYNRGHSHRYTFQDTGPSRPYA